MTPRYITQGCPSWQLASSISVQKITGKEECMHALRKTYLLELENAHDPQLNPDTGNVEQLSCRLYFQTTKPLQTAAQESHQLIQLSLAQNQHPCQAASPEVLEARSICNLRGIRFRMHKMSGQDGAMRTWSNEDTGMPTITFSKLIHASISDL
eukprot:1155947-Pelagomonas_calceolata.AAC.2